MVRPYTLLMVILANTFASKAGIANPCAQSLIPAPIAPAPLIRSRYMEDIPVSLETVYKYIKPYVVIDQISLTRMLALDYREAMREAAIEAHQRIFFRGASLASWDPRKNGAPEVWIEKTLEGVDVANPYLLQMRSLMQSEDFSLSFALRSEKSITEDGAFLYIDPLTTALGKDAAADALIHVLVHGHRVQNRPLLEKPFGHSYSSFMWLNLQALTVFELNMLEYEAELIAKFAGMGFRLPSAVTRVNRLRSFFAKLDANLTKLGVNNGDSKDLMYQLVHITTLLQEKFGLKKQAKVSYLEGWSKYLHKLWFEYENPAIEDFVRRIIIDPSLHRSQKHGTLRLLVLNAIDEQRAQDLISLIKREYESAIASYTLNEEQRQQTFAFAEVIQLLERQVHVDENALIKALAYSEIKRKNREPLKDLLLLERAAGFFAD